MDADRIADLRPRLVERQSALLARHAALDRHLRQADGRLEADFADRVPFTELDEVIEGLDEAAVRELQAIRGALARMDRGSYGICSDCGGEIAIERLRALPHAARCGACARERE